MYHLRRLIQRVCLYCMVVGGYHFLKSDKSQIHTNKIIRWSAIVENVTRNLSFWNVTLVSFCRCFWWLLRMFEYPEYTCHLPIHDYHYRWIITTGVCFKTETSTGTIRIRVIVAIIIKIRDPHISISVTIKMNVMVMVFNVCKRNCIQKSLLGTCTKTNESTPIKKHAKWF